MYNNNGLRIRTNITEGGVAVFNTVVKATEYISISSKDMDMSFHMIKNKLTVEPEEGLFLFYGRVYRCDELILVGGDRETIYVNGKEMTKIASFKKRQLSLYIISDMLTTSKTKKEVMSKNNKKKEKNLVVFVDDKRMQRHEHLMFKHSYRYLQNNEEEQEMENKLTEQDKFDLAAGQFQMLSEGKFNTEEGGIKVGRYPTIKMFNICYNHTAGFRTKEGKDLLPIIEKAYQLSYKKSYKNSLEVEKAFKEIKVVNTLAVDISVATIADGETEEDDILVNTFNFDTRIENKQEGSVVRYCKIEKRTIADTLQSQTGEFTSDIISVSLKGDTGNSYNVNKFISLVDDININNKEKSDKGLFIVIRKSGFCSAYERLSIAAKNAKEDDEIHQYVFGYDTPSSLKKAGITAFKINSYTKDKKGDIVLTNHKDIRTGIIDKSLDGALTKEFQDLNGNWMFLKTKEDLFKKYKTRVGLGAPASKNLPLKMKNYIVLECIAFNAGYNSTNYSVACDFTDPNFVDCGDTKDGTTFVSTEFKKNNFDELGINVDINTLRNLCVQTRGGGTKDSAQTPTRSFIQILTKKLLNRGASIEYVVLDGVKIENPSKEQIKIAINQMDGLFDSNAMKLMKHNPEFTVVAMKQAHQSDSCLNMAVDIALLAANSKETVEMLENKGKEEIISAFSQFGVDIKFNDEGKLKDISVDYERIKGINAASQDVEWLRNCAPEIMDAINPGYLMTKFDGITKSLSKKIESLRFSADCKYSVVQADPAPLFGVRILDDDEVFDPTCPEKRVAFVRHPMSGVHAVSTWNCVNLMEIITRIQKLKGVTNEDRQALVEYFATVKNFIVIPASHYLMEKHDGMDFDIDAGQEFRDPTVVNIFAQVCELGTIIDRKKDEANNCSTSLCAEELIIKEWVEKRNSEAFIPLVRPEKDDKTKTKEKRISDSNTGKGRIQLASDFTKDKIIDEKDFFDMNAEGHYAATYHNNLLLFKQYQLNPVAPIGLIATGFYNNALLYSTLNNKAVNTEDKKYITELLHSKFGNKGTKEYESPLNKVTEDGKIKYTLDKKTVIETLFRYAECDGSVESTIKFIFDAMICNRYVAESSIDSAKKMYMVADYFNFTDIFRSLGSDKNVHVRQLAERENTEEFNDLTSRFNSDGSYGENNFFDVKFLGVMFNALDDKTFKKSSILHKVKSGKITDDKTPIEETTKMKTSIGIKDELFQLRSRLTEFANDLIYLTAKKMEAQIKSLKANEIRNKLKNVDIDKNALAIVSNTNSVGITMSSSISPNEEIDEIASKTYRDTNLKSTLKNTAMLGFNGGELQYTDEEIGEVVVNYLINNYNNNKSTAGKCRRSANMVLSVYMKEVIAYLSSLDDINFIYGEKIQRMSKNGKNVLFQDYNFDLAAVINGRGEVEDKNVQISCKNKKASLVGAIQEFNGSYYIVADREDSFDKDSSTGIYAAIKNTAGFTGRKALTVYEKNMADKMNSVLLSAKNPDFLNSYELKFERKAEVNGETLYNVLFTINEEGRKIPFCELNISNTVAKVLSNIDINLSSLLFFCDSEYGVLQIRNEEIEKAIHDSYIAEMDISDSEENTDDMADIEEGSDFDPIAFFLNGQESSSITNQNTFDEDITPVL